MAEIIGLVSSIAGLVDIAAKVSIGLLKVAKEIGEAGQQIRIIARHTNLISNVLNNLHTVIHQRGHVTTSSLRGQVLVEDALEHCLEILNDCERLVRIFEPLIEKSGRKRTRATLRIRMLFEKSKFMAHGDALEKLTGILTLLVTSMTYSQATHSNTTEKTNESLRVQVESSITNVEDSRSSRINITKLLTYPRTFGEHLSIRESDDPPQNESNYQSLIDFDDGWAESESTRTSMHLTENIISIEANSAGSSEHGLEKQSTSSTIEMDVVVDEGWDGTSEEIYNSDGKFLLSDKDLDDMLDKEFAFADLEAFLEPYMALKSLERKTVQFAQAILDKGAQLDEEEEESGLTDDDAFSDARDVRSGGESDDEDEDGEELEVLRVRDVRGQVFNLPFETAKTWEGLNTLLLEIYAGRPEYMEKLRNQRDNFRFHKVQHSEYDENGSEREVRIGDDDLILKRFQLYGPDGNPILPRVWHQVIEPSDLITMRFADEKLNGIGSHPISIVEKSMGWLRSWWNPGQAGGSSEKDRQKIRFVRKKEPVDLVSESGSGSSGSDLMDD